MLDQGVGERVSLGIVGGAQDVGLHCGVAQVDDRILVEVGERGQRRDVEVPADHRGKGKGSFGVRAEAGQTVAHDPHVVGDLLWATLSGLVLTQMIVTETVDSTPSRVALIDALVAYLEPSRREV